MNPLDKIIEERRKKLNFLIKKGYQPYSSITTPISPISGIIKHFIQLTRNKERVAVAGRIMGLRQQGGLIFIDLVDQSGKLQGIFQKKTLSDFDLLKKTLDIGDFIVLSGKTYKTKRGEKSLDAISAQIITKSLRPLPSTWYGLKDIEERYRKRWLDLIFNKEVKDIFVKRTKIIETLREILKQEGFLELETPVLQPLAGGAAARPFETHLNALDLDLYLRIAPELYLKRVLVGGFEKIFELGKNFRNEGIDREHNPEFTMLELYWAYQNYQGLMNFVEKIFMKLLVNLKIKQFSVANKKINLKRPWKRITFEKIIKKYTGLDINKSDIKEIYKFLESENISYEKNLEKFELFDLIFKKVVRKNIISPIFVVDYPKEISPLAKAKEIQKNLAERFQLIIGGLELVNGFSELNDPLDQRERFKYQERRRQAGNLETAPFDEDFLEALEYGMPPAAGLGLGIDRLVMLLTGTNSLREVILFPTMRSRSQSV